MMQNLTTEERRIVQAVVERCPPDARILDLGCGMGKIAFAIAERLPDAQVLGLDGDTDRVARLHEFQQLPNLRYCYALLKDVRLEQDRYDAVVFSNVIEHLLDPGVALLKIHRALKPDGIMVLTTDNVFYVNSFGKAILQSLGLMRTRSQVWRHQEGRFFWWNQHVLMWNMDALSTLVTICGFDVCERRYITCSSVSLRDGLLLFKNIVERVLPFLRAKLFICALKRSPTEEELLYHKNNDF
jgi:ubiquinone/menaquinone biosynthesis C-methylase UbiE